VKFECKYCKKSFSKETTLLSHVCEPKRRYQQQHETGVQLALRAYLRFYEMTSSSKKRNYDDFASSPYYNAFVKFGRYLVSIRAVNPGVYIEWLLKNNKKLDYWCKDSFYDEWLKDYLKKEAPQDALERALKEMENYADSNEDLKNGFSDYFKFGNNNRICHHIVTGRISPWVVFNCSSGVDFLDGLNEGQLKIIMPYVDPDFWQKKFKDYPEDVAWVKDILGKAGL
jgi:hypothetical protein